MNETWRILILNLVPNTVGDNVLLTKVFSIIKKALPDSYLAATISPLNQELWKGDPHLDELIVVEQLRQIARDDFSTIRKSWPYLKMLISLIKTLRRRRFDLCFCLLPNFFPSRLIPWLSRIPARIGFTYPGSHLDRLLTAKTAYRGLLETKDYTRHFLESYYDLLALAGIPVDRDGCFAEKIVAREELAEAKGILQRKGIDPDRPFVIFHCSSKSAPWPWSRFKSVIMRLRKEQDIPVVLIGSKREIELNERIKGKDERIVNVAGQVSLEQVAALLQSASFAVCNDSGIAHLCSAVGTPAVVLYGPHHPNHCLPQGRGKTHVIYKFSKEDPYANRDSKEAMERIKTISVQDVVERIRKEGLL